MTIPFGSGDLGKIISGAGFNYQFTWDDMLWAARAILGEAGANAAGVEGAAVLWTWAQRMIFRRERGIVDGDGTFKGLVRAHSQPVNPKFLNAGPEHLQQRRQRIQNTSWEELDTGIKRNVVDWARGLKENPVPKAVDFAVPKVASNGEGSRGLKKRNFLIIWDTLNRGPDSVDRGGNVFYARADKTKGSTQWPNGYVKISGTKISSETTPTEYVNKNGGPDPAKNEKITNESKPVVETKEDVKERFEKLTKGRTEPNQDIKYTYFTVPEGKPQGEDPHVNDNQILNFETRNIPELFTPFEKFEKQVNAFKNTSNLELTKTVPVIKIWMKDENGNFVNLNEKIFSKSPFENVFSASLEDSVRFPGRPLASIQNFSKKVQPPPVGGPLAVAVSNLKLRVNNTDLVRDDHPTGKFIDWLFRPGITVKVEYGLKNDSPSEAVKDVFTVRSEDFITSQQEFTMNNDLTMDVNITLTPAWHKLSEQFLVGQSIPAKFVPDLTSEDVDQIVNSTVSEDASKQQKNRVKKLLFNVQRHINTGEESIGPNTKVSGSTISETIQGALSDLEIINKPDTVEPVVLENFVEGLQSIQSLLLTRRFEKIFERVSYKTNVKGATFVAVNAGAIFGELLLPEIQNIVEVINKKQINIGSFSDVNATEEDNTEGKNKFRLIFGNFNDKAGDFANKPISTFPVNVDDLLTFVKEKRELGRFSDSLNNFIGRITNQMNSRHRYIAKKKVDRQRTIDEIETPDVKYSFYPNPDPDDDASWIFYVYDNKQFQVKLAETTKEISGEGSRPTDAEIKKIVREHEIPWIELGANYSFIKDIQGQTKADDTLMAHFLWEANQDINARQLDTAKKFQGINRSFLAETMGKSADNPDDKAAKSSKLILPLQLSVNTYMLTDVINFAHLYIFFPMNMFSALYTIYEINHEIDKNGASTNLTLMINRDTSLI